MFDPFGPDMPLVAKFFIAFAVVLALIGLTAWLVRRYSSDRLGGALPPATWTEHSAFLLRWSAYAELKKRICSRITPLKQSHSATKKAVLVACSVRRRCPVR